MSDSTAADLSGWLRLSLTPGVGPETGRRLLSALGLPEQIFATGEETLRAIVSPKVARAISTAPSDTVLALIDRTLEWVAQPGNHALTLADPLYPRHLLDTTDPPLLLYVKGRMDLLSTPSLAVVGSRNATAQGVRNAEQFSEALSKMGLTIVSGLALGIDAAAHEGGLRGRGSTVAVIGTGLDIVYPARNHRLAHEIAERGCIVSEYSLGTPALAPNFPRRNRIISGLSRGVLVIEAAAQSGSLITARLAGEQGRDVFAIPGSIHSPLAKGCHELIKQGAKLVESASDVLDELGVAVAATTPTPAASATAQAGASDVLQAMSFDPVDIGTLAERCSMEISKLHAELLILELDGRVEMLPGSMVRQLAGA